ncbi:uncharacterized protein LACBIDRAFT_333762 [Laccaria bicolor S238N-H82]|uniref:Predicted protein n=1 Tax=Laccaria bicolor (strain S238N-H82 / ATCC MYA-4686) TaxID=486041 RepID=B0DWZ8_LACBS|nr:uncharacterized protein LACBIDRAFT_333762 [Laccaria bicolor S238N-H82]EDR00900.1 predicted protein [Laccaria bicolor S238N-H82]|eukprot:XP_001888494.1 predicted protein [Laccaria bicolor S238N-H82]
MACGVMAIFGQLPKQLEKLKFYPIYWKEYCTAASHVIVSHMKTTCSRAAQISYKHQYPASTFQSVPAPAQSALEATSELEARSWRQASNRLEAERQGTRDKRERGIAWFGLLDTTNIPQLTSIQRKSLPTCTLSLASVSAHTGKHRMAVDLPHHACVQANVVPFPSSVAAAGGGTHALLRSSPTLPSANYANTTTTEMPSPDDGVQVDLEAHHYASARRKRWIRF